jgi:hypothetical protein
MRTNSYDPLEGDACWDILILAPSGFYEPKMMYGTTKGGTLAGAPLHFKPLRKARQAREDGYLPQDRGHVQDAFLQILIQTIELMCARWQDLYLIVRKE